MGGRLRVEAAHRPSWCVGRRNGRALGRRRSILGGSEGRHQPQRHGPAGYAKPVAVKRLHAPRAKDQELTTMFLDEARVTSGLMHPNIVMTLDVLDEPDGLYLVMEYVHGASLAMLHKQIPRDVA